MSLLTNPNCTTTKYLVYLTGRAVLPPKVCAAKRLAVGQLAALWCPQRGGRPARYNLSLDSESDVERKVVMPS